MIHEIDPVVLLQQVQAPAQRRVQAQDVERGRHGNGLGVRMHDGACVAARGPQLGEVAREGGRRGAERAGARSALDEGGGGRDGHGEHHRRQKNIVADIVDGEMRWFKQIWCFMASRVQIPDARTVSERREDATTRGLHLVGEWAGLLKVHLLQGEIPSNYLYVRM